MKKTNNYGLILVILLGLASCVPQSKFKQSQQLNDLYRTELDSLQSMVVEANDFTDFEYKEVEAELKSTQADLTDLQESYNYNKKYNDDILKRYDELLAQNKALLSASSSETQTMIDDLSKRQTTIDQQNREIKRLQNRIQELENDLITLRGPASIPPSYSPPVVERIVTNDCANYERQVAELNNLLNQKETRLNSLRTKVNQALLGFNAADLSVSESRGKIYVSLSQNLLFASNSDKIDWTGKKAIRSLATVLNQNPDINITVEGHTDSEGSAQKNWDLSVQRATSVVDVLTEAKVDPRRITASGRSFYFPVAPNTTTAGKAKNRRTEIILSPNLDELYKIINE